MNETTGDLGPPPPTPEEAAAIRIRRWNRFYKIAVIWLIICVGLIVEKILNRGSVMDGLRDGFMASAFTAPFMMPVALVLGWVGSLIGRLKPLRRFRLLLTFALPTLITLMGVVEAVRGQCFPEQRFQRLTGVEFPSDARVERYVYDDGWSPFYDWSHTFEISCPAEVTERLIREMHLKRIPATPLMSATGPTSTGWLLTTSWQGDGRKEGHFIELDANATGTKLRIRYFTI